MGEVGRFRMNTKLGLDIDIDQKVLTKIDIITIIKYLIELINSKAQVIGEIPIYPNFCTTV